MTGEPITIEIEFTREILDSMALTYAIYSRLSPEDHQRVADHISRTTVVRHNPTGLRRACENVGMLLLMQIVARANQLCEEPTP